VGGFENIRVSNRIVTPPRVPAPLPARVPWLVRGFLRYVRRLVRRSTHAVRVLHGHGPPPPPPPPPEVVEGSAGGAGDGSGGGSGGVPVIVYMNHPSWWDPMAAAVMATTHFADRRHYAPIDAAMLGQYGVFKRLGFYGIAADRRRGAVDFLRTTEAILDSHSAGDPVAVWVTAQGDFVDVRVRPVRLAGGVARVVARAAAAGRGLVVLPMAVEYAWWDQKTPEVLVAYGEPLVVGGESTDADVINADLEARLTAAMDALASASIARDPEAFDVVLGGKAGVGGAYDWARRLKAWVTGKRFDPRHGEG